MVHGESGGSSSHHAAGAHGDVVTVNYCVETEEIHESHGIHVASWRWAEVQTYYAITLFIVIAGLAKLGRWPCREPDSPNSVRLRS